MSDGEKDSRQWTTCEKNTDKPAAEKEMKSAVSVDCLVFEEGETLWCSDADRKPEVS